MVESSHARKRRLILESVFIPEILQPTPATTPGQSFQPQHFPLSATPTTLQHLQHDQVRFSRAWHVVTSAIALPPRLPAESDVSSFDVQQACLYNPELPAAVAEVVNTRSRLPRTVHQTDILQWHTQQVRRHFVSYVLPALAAAAERSSDTGSVDDISKPNGSDCGDKALADALVRHARVLVSTVRLLEAVDVMYNFGASVIALGYGDAPAARKAMARFEQDVHAVVDGSLLCASHSAAPLLVQATRTVVSRLVALVLEVPGPTGRLGNEERKALGLAPQYQEAQQAHTMVRAAMEKREKPNTLVLPEYGMAVTRHEVATASARKALLDLVKALRKVGLAGEKFQMLFAEVMDAAMEEFVDRSYSNDWGDVAIDPMMTMPRQKHRWRWGGLASSGSGVKGIGHGSGGSRCMNDVCDWIENCFSRLATEVTACIETTTESTMPSISWSTVEKWKELALGRLATLRINELYDMILEWPNAYDALDDLRSAISITANPTTSSFAPPGGQQRKRLQLTDTFGVALQKRLLHPGRSTLHILRFYIAMIRTFHSLDHSKALLARVMQRLQSYLCQRDDAIRIVVSGMLVHQTQADNLRAEYSRALKSDRSLGARAGLTDIPDGPPELIELSDIIALGGDTTGQVGGDGAGGSEEAELDWEDMEWTPAPIDAGQGFRRSKTEDVIGTLIDALSSSPEVFMREFEAILAERLLGITITADDQETPPPPTSATVESDNAATLWDQELRVAYMLERRFGKQAMQATHVMLRDMADSLKLDNLVSVAVRDSIAKDATNKPLRKPPASAAQAEPSSAHGYPSAAANAAAAAIARSRLPKDKDADHTTSPFSLSDIPAPPVHATILSRLFWPNLSNKSTVATGTTAMRAMWAESFELPSNAQRLLKLYEDCFELQRQGRRLDWLPGLGTAVVDIELGDCKFIDLEVRIFEAVVIYAFADKDDDGSDNGMDHKEIARGSRETKATSQWGEKGGRHDVDGRRLRIRKTPQQLETELGMAPELVQAALDSWVARNVLAHNVDKGDYWVRERADDVDEESEAEVLAADSDDEVEDKNRDVNSLKKKPMDQQDPQRAIYWQFVVGMLTNSGAMAPVQIDTMMRILIPGGFPWSNEQLLVLLDEKVEAGLLELTGGKYRLVKP